ncbi:MAG: hypothetical protein LQ343_000555 [Gyalolechia ehrenbergii]|nr:MAG: hypothetical protein LQ343_000555 [Gyalolechia ehrenbergii]
MPIQPFWESHSANSTEDVEAQSNIAREPYASDTKQPEYVHSGRGGAGNYNSASDVAERQRSVDMPPTTRERTVPEGGFYGRGGAGNLRDSEGKPQEEAGRKSNQTQQEQYEMAVQDVEQGLQAPEKAHLAKQSM